MSLNGNREVFRNRRRRFIDSIAGGIAVLPSAPIAMRNGDVEFIYRQDSDFYYLTAFTEPESVALFAPGHKDGEFVMFVRSRDKDRETWTGRRAGVEGAIVDYGADKAYTIEELGQVLPRYLQSAERVHAPLDGNEKLSARILDMVRAAQAMRPRLGEGPSAMLDPRELIHEMRLFKSAEELDLMRRAIAISGEAHARAMREARAGMIEWQVEALIDYTFRSRGAAGPSYPSIVASADNATILHYINNDRELRAGELMLIDAGCEYQFYASDITRTFPIASRFSPQQRDLYEVVLEAQRVAIEAIKPGVKFDDPHEAALRVLVDGMRHHGLLKGSTEECISAGSYRRYYMHRTSHWLGMDVHDCGLYRRAAESRKLEPGMVLTAEPGIYVPIDDESAPDALRGIGIRIEDDVLVTSDGHEVMSAAIPKTVAEVEALTTAG